MNRTGALSLAALLLITGIRALRAQDLIVGPPGSAAAFNRINDAIAAATPGQRILVLAGEYRESLRLDRPIDLIGEGAALTRVVSSLSGPFGSDTALTWTGVPAGAASTVRGMGFAFGSIGAFISSSPAVVGLSGCAGNLSLQDVVIEAPGRFAAQVAAGRATLLITDCASVLLDRVSIRGVVDSTLLLSGATGPVADGPAGLSALRSVVWMNDCTCQGTSVPTQVFGGPVGRGGPGVRAQDSQLWITNSTLRGATGSAAVPGALAFGGPGLELSNSNARVAGGGMNRMQGAHAAEVNAGLFSNAAPGALLLQGSLLELASDAVLASGSSLPALPPAPPAVVADPTSAALTLALRLPGLTWTRNSVAAGTRLALEVRGEPFSPTALAVTPALGSLQVLPGVLGFLATDLSAPLLLVAFPQGATGRTTFEAIVPPGPLPFALPFFAQSLQLVGNAAELSPPAGIALGP